MSDVPTIPFDQYTRPFRDRVGDALRAAEEHGHIIALTGPGSVTDPAGLPDGYLPGINDTDAPVGEVPALVAVPGDRWVAPPSSQAGLASFRYARRAEPVLPYPDDEVTNALVELDIAEEAERAATLARTADRLAAAYAAHVGFLRTSKTQPQGLSAWTAGNWAAREELAAALAEYEEARA